MFDINTVGDRLVVTFPDRMDTLACQKIENQMSQLCDQTDKSVTFDLTGVTYVSSAFLRICIKTVHAFGQEKVELVNMAPEIKKVFKISGLDSQVAIR